MTKSKQPVFKKNSRMKNYSIIFDKEIMQNRPAFYKFNVGSRITQTKSDEVFVITKGLEHRLDLISVKFYGTSVYDWIIAEFNNIEDPIKDIVAGKKIVIPNKNKLGII